MRAVTALALTWALLSTPSPTASAGRLLVTVGDVTPTAGVVWARGMRGGSVVVEVAPVGGTAVVRMTAPLLPDADATAKLPLTGLRPATRYRYRLESHGDHVDGEFTTAPAPGEPARVTFVWSGDLGGGGFCRVVGAGYPIFTTMARSRPDFFLFVGDTVYADQRCGGPGIVPGSDFAATSLAQFHAKHRYNREDATVQAFFRATSVYAIWDDHEVGNDFDATDPRLPTGRRAFLDYWPIVPPAEEPTRLYRRFQWGRLLEVFILDTRQYRSPDSALDGPGKTMLGAAQRRWLVDAVSTSGATWKAVVSTVPLALPTGRPERRDSWSNANVWGTPQEHGTGFATERDALLRQFHERGVRNLVFVVADVHHAELIRHRPRPAFAFHEFIAGPLSASLGRPRPLDEGLNPRSIFAHGGTNSFGEVTIDAARLTVRLIDGEGAVLFTHALAPE